MRQEQRQPRTIISVLMIFRWTKIFIFCAFFSTATQISQAQHIDINTSEAGTCLTPEKENVSLEDLNNISQKWVILTDKPKTYLVIAGDSVLISENKTGFPVSRYFDIPPIIEKRDRLDLVLHHAEINHVRYIYWSETFRNRQNRRGLIKFDGGRMRLICAGFDKSIK